MKKKINMHLTFKAKSECLMLEIYEKKRIVYINRIKLTTKEKKKFISEREKKNKLTCKNWPEVL